MSVDRIKSGPVLPTSQLTAEARARREAISAEMHDCPHGVNMVLSRCDVCDAESIARVRDKLFPSCREDDQ